MKEVKFKVNGRRIGDSIWITLPPKIVKDFSIKEGSEFDAIIKGNTINLSKSN